MAKVQLPSLLAGLVFGCAATACSTDTTAAATVVTTAVGLDPVDFLGTVPCTGQAGGALFYVVTINDESNGVAEGNRSFTSQPISCAVPVAFENVLVGHSYSANVAVFDSAAAGATPRWTTTCGDPGTPGGLGRAEVFTDQRAYIKNCIPLTGAGVGKTSISIDASALASSVGCSMSATDTNKIEKLRVTSIGSTLPGQTIGCGQPAIVVDTGIEPGKLYSFRVEGLAPGATKAGWAATCTATAKDGIAVSASCGALSDVGYIRVDAVKLVADAALVCAASGPDAVGSYDVSFDEPPMNVKASTISCKNDAVLGPFTVGSHAGEIFLHTALGAPKAHAICFAAVEPDATVTASCIPD